MKKYEVTIECMYRSRVEVNAESNDEAIKKVEDNLMKGEGAPEFDGIWDSLKVTNANEKTN